MRENNMTTIEKLNAQIEGLQNLVQFLSDKPELEKQIWVPSSHLNVSIHSYQAEDKKANTERKKQFSSLIRLLSKGTKLAKEYTDYSCKVVRKFSSNVQLEVSINREAVCERIVKEVKEVPGYYIEARKEEVVEWKCK